ncbi:HTTM domain-containing protein [Nannocystaceae bacterium ST9]
MATWLVDFFTAPILVFGLGMARAMLGSLLVVDGARHLVDADVWLNPDALGLRRRPSASGVWWRIVEMSWRPRVYLVAHCGFGVLLALGLGGSVPAGLAYLTFRRIHRANRYVLYGGDAVLRMAVLLLACSPCTASLSLDRWLTAGDLGVGVEAPPWGMRLLQIELAVLYFYNCWYKLAHAAWREGTAVFYPLNNADIRNHRLPIPRVFMTRPMVALGTWGTLALEFALGFGLWIAELRPSLLVCAVALHLAIAYAFSLWLFSYIMFGCLCVFIDPRWFFAIGEISIHAWGPQTSLGMILGLSVACAYVVFALYWDPPHGSLVSRVIRERLGPLFRRIGMVRRWRLFSGNPPAGRLVTLVMTSTDGEGRIRKWGWNQTIGLFDEDPLLDKRTVWNHRLRKFASSLLRVPDAQQRFGHYVLQLARARGIDARALTVDARFDHLGHIDTGEPLEPIAHRNLFTYLAPVEDERPLTALACALGERSRSPLCIDVLVYVGARSIAEGRSDLDTLAAIRLAAQTDWPTVADEEISVTRSFVIARIRDEQRRELYEGVLDALTGRGDWPSVIISIDRLMNRESAA